jgi:glycosyltransferase involved in cell wall biosynthesis|tara:strand:+ start:589 stop:1281 length:693 start_codon:yes stop_codon:yes gene_type:complete
MKLSIIIPVYNEIVTIKTIIDKVKKSNVGTCQIEIIVIDDASTDGTKEILNTISDQVDKIIFNPTNRGKGYSVRKGIESSSGDIILIQDADLEYDPADYMNLIAPVTDGKADVVFGSRFVGGQERRVMYFWHTVANQCLTLLSNMMTNLNLTDMETCYKVFKKNVLNKITLKEDRFGFEPEITAKVAKLKIRIYEVGISYSGRTYAEGKKIGLKDAFSALRCIFRYSFFN